MVTDIWIGPCRCCGIKGVKPGTGRESHPCFHHDVIGSTCMDPENESCYKVNFNTDHIDASAANMQSRSGVLAV